MPLVEVAFLSAKNVLSPLATMAWASAINSAIQKKRHGGGVVKAGKGINLAYSNEDVDDVIRIIKSLESRGVLIVEVGKTVKHKNEK